MNCTLNNIIIVLINNNSVHNMYISMKEETLSQLYVDMMQLLASTTFVLLTVNFVKV